MPSWLSATLIVGTLLAVIIGGIVLLSAPVSDWISRAPSIVGDLQTKMRALHGVTDTVAQVSDQVEKITSGAAAKKPPEVVVKQPGLAASLAWIAPLFLAQIVFVLVLVFFLLSSGDMVYENIVHVLPTLSDKKRAVRIARDIEQKLSSYLFTITLINIGLGIVIGTVMWSIGMPNPLLFGVAVFTLNYIPYAGPATGVELATVVGLISGNGLWLGALAGGSYLLIATFEGHLITPYFVGRRLRLNTVVVFLSIALWAWLWSVVGMIVATPLLVGIRTFCEYIPSLEGVGAFLSARGDEQDETCQRQARPEQAIGLMPGTQDRPTTRRARLLPQAPAGRSSSPVTPNMPMAARCRFSLQLADPPQGAVRAARSRAGAACMSAVRPCTTSRISAMAARWLCSTSSTGCCVTPMAPTMCAMCATSPISTTGSSMRARENGRADRGPNPPHDRVNTTRTWPRSAHCRPMSSRAAPGTWRR